MRFIISCFFFLSSIFYTHNCYGFILNATPVNESCLGNGEINFSVSNTDPNGSMLFIIYALPDSTNPYATTTNNYLNGLSSGTYRVVAREMVGNSSTTQQIEVTISNTIIPLSYTISSFNQACSASSTITINSTSGNAVSYEIFNGPVTVPLQTSNTFTNLPVGVYKIRVFDACGIGVVTTYTVTNNPTGLLVTDPILSNTTCTSTEVNQIITPADGTIIAYPLTIQYTIHPPTGAP